MTDVQMFSALCSTHKILEKMKMTDGTKVPKFSIEKELHKCGKLFLKMCGIPEFCNSVAGGGRQS